MLKILIDLRILTFYKKNFYDSKIYPKTKNLSVFTKFIPNHENLSNSDPIKIWVNPLSWGKDTLLNFYTTQITYIISIFYLWVVLDSIYSLISSVIFRTSESFAMDRNEKQVRKKLAYFTGFSHLTNHRHPKFELLVQILSSCNTEISKQMKYRISWNFSRNVTFF